MRTVYCFSHVFWNGQNNLLCPYKLQKVLATERKSHWHIFWWARIPLDSIWYHCHHWNVSMLPIFLYESREMHFPPNVHFRMRKHTLCVRRYTLSVRSWFSALGMHSPRAENLLRTQDQTSCSEREFCALRKLLIARSAQASWLQCCCTSPYHIK